MNTPHNIYIHVPFCVSKCKYCAFFSHAVLEPDWDTYLNNIISEITYWREKMGQIPVPTIFFGGGTPSLMPTHIFEKIMRALYDNFDIYPTAEITLESNPGTLDETRLSEFVHLGVNRLSIGVQALDDERLKFLGRRHTVRDALKLIDAAQSQHIRVSCDFIYGLPGDNCADTIRMCNKINELRLKHCSLYELTLEPDTPFGKMNLDMPSNSTMADMYNAIADTLSIPRYEVSNYATPDNECLHNQNVWDGEPYIGIGRGAAGRVLINGTWFEQRGAHAQFDILSPTNRAIEMIITGLRQVRGLRINSDISAVINSDFIASNPDLIYCTDDNRITTTAHGMLILDEILEKIIK